MTQRYKKRHKAKTEREINLSHFAHYVTKCFLSAAAWY